MIDDKSFELLVKQIDRIEVKVDNLMEHKWQWTGKMSIIVTLITVVGSIVVSIATVIISK